MKVTLIILVLFAAVSVNGQMNPQKVRETYTSCCGGGCSQVSYKLYEVDRTMYIFFSRDISDKIAAIKPTLMEMGTFLKYYTNNKCLVVQLKDKEDRRALQGYLTSTLCDLYRREAL